MQKKNNQNMGFVVVEALLSASILVIFFTAFMGIIIYNQKIYENLNNRQKATLLAEEGLEATRSIRDSDFASLSDGAHGIGVSSNKWTFSSSSDTTEIFNRQVSISSISSEIKQVDSIVNWTSSNNISQSVSLTTYLTDWARIVENNVCWDNPYIESGLSVGSCASGLEVVGQGDYAYMTKSGTSYFSIINVSNPASPSIVGICANTNCSMSGTLNGLAVQGDYAYIASSDNNNELYVVNIANKASPRRVFNYNATGSGDGRALYIDNNYLYMTRDYSSGNNGYTFLVFSLANPASPSLVGYLALENSCLDVAVSGSYAYVSCSNSREFQAIDVSNPGSMSLSRRYPLNLSGSGTGRSITVIGNTAYIGKNEGYIYSINITTPTSPSVISSYYFGSSPYDTAAIGNDILAITGSSIFGEIEFIDVSDPSSMSEINHVDPLGSYAGGGIYYDEEKNRIYTAGACLPLSGNQEFLIIN